MFCITVQQRNTETEAKRVGKLVFVDLAGSEMARKSQAVGLQLEEAKEHQQMPALGQVINALTDEKKVHIPTVIPNSLACSRIRLVVMQKLD